MADEKKKSKLELAFDEFEQEVAGSNVIRKELITQLREDVKKMRVSEFDKAMMVTAKMSIVGTLQSMMKDVEDSAMKRVKLHMNKQEQENNGQHAAAVLELLKLVRADGQGSHENAHPVQKEADVQAELTKRGAELKVDKFTDGELEKCGTLPMPSVETSEEPKKEKKK